MAETHGHAHGHAHGRDEYLMTIYLLAYPVGEYAAIRRGPKPTAPARVAEMLGVSRASVGEMLGRLESQGLVSRGEKKEALLTARGMELAMATVRRHRMLELLLTEVLGYTGAEAHEKADAIDSGFDDEMIERLYEKLGQPERCPHGYPVDADHELRENPTLMSLARSEVGTTSTVVRLAEHDGALLHAFYDIGVTPGIEVTLTSIDEDGAVIHDAGSGAEVDLTITQAQGIFVRPSGVPVVPATATCWGDILRRERELAAD